MDGVSSAVSLPRMTWPLAGVNTPVPSRGRGGISDGADGMEKLKPSTVLLLFTIIIIVVIINSYP